MAPFKSTEKCRTGIPGFDHILAGGLPKNRIYLVEGDPGVGKTTLALQFLLEGARSGERCLYITLSETTDELLAVGRSHGWSLDSIAIHEMYAGDGAIEPHDDENTLYVPSEVELGERMRELLAEIDRVKPHRIVVDSCSELRLLAQTPLRFRRQILAFKANLIQRGCTIVLLENITSASSDVLLQSLVHGVLVMQQHSPAYGRELRRLRVVKLREVAFRGGYHDFTIEHDGISVYPRLIAAEHHEPFARDVMSCGVPGLDSLLGGGLDRGTSALLIGPAGSGKSAIATQYACAAAARGEPAVIFTFDEGIGTLFSRASAIGMPLKEHVGAGLITVQQIDPAEMSPGQFTHITRLAAEKGARLITIDSLNGYMHAMPDERFLMAQLHELLSYLRQRGIVTVMVVAQHGLLGRDMSTPVDVSYLADTVVVTRFFESKGRVKKALSCLKRRAGYHEDTIREFSLGAGGLCVGPPLEQFRGVMTGVPVLEGGRSNDATSVPGGP
jgi:circadian clock protein KaiC